MSYAEDEAPDPLIRDFTLGSFVRERNEPYPTMSSALKPRYRLAHPRSP